MSHGVNKTDFLDILQAKIDYVLDFMVFVANLSGFSNSKRFQKDNSLCGHTEYCNIPLYDALKFEKKLNIIKTYCVKSMAIN